MTFCPSTKLCAVILDVAVAVDCERADVDPVVALVVVVGRIVIAVGVGVPHPKISQKNVSSASTLAPEKAAGAAVR